MEATKVKKYLNIEDFKYSSINKHIEHEIFGFLDLDTWQTSKGVERFQGIIFWKDSGNIKPDFTPPIDLLYKARAFKIDHNYKEGIPYIVWTIWFNKESPYNNLKLNEDEKSSKG